MKLKEYIKAILEQLPPNSCADIDIPVIVVDNVAYVGDSKVSMIKFTVCRRK